MGVDSANVEAVVVATFLGFFVGGLVKFFRAVVDPSPTKEEVLWSSMGERYETLDHVSASSALSLWKKSFHVKVMEFNRETSMTLVNANTGQKRTVHRRLIGSGDILVMMHKYCSVKDKGFPQERSKLGRRKRIHSSYLMLIASSLTSIQNL